MALGHPFFSVLPGLFVMSTIWLREHNRICDILTVEHPQWDDDRLYHTAKLIILGQNLKIAIEEYVQHLSQYKVKLKYDPELLRDQHFQYSNRIHIEFAHLYHWHPLMPDTLTLNNNTYSMKQLSFKTQPVLEHGFAKFVDAMMTQPAGAVSLTCLFSFFKMNRLDRILFITEPQFQLGVFKINFMLVFTIKYLILERFVS